MRQPKIKRTEFLEMIKDFDIDRKKYPLILAGIRGYYKNSMGVPNENDRGIYDDCIIIDSEKLFLPYPGNTDPSKVRKGTGFSTKKGMAVLQPGVYYAHKFDIHNGSNPHPAICQRLGTVKVKRDGLIEDYSDEGNFGINIHKGGDVKTHSEGCQTLPNYVWANFYSTAKKIAMFYHKDNFDKVVIPYVLIEN